MLIFMPKISHYSAVSDKMKATVDNNIKGAISKFVPDDDNVSAFIEDELACQTPGVTSYITFTRERELSSISQLDIFGEYIASIEALYSSAKKFTLDFKKMKMPDIKLLYTDKNAYIKQYIKFYIERAHDCIRTLLQDEEKVALVFTFRGKNDNPIVPVAEENDQILYIYCDIETGVIHGMYSGIWVNVEMVEQILGGIYHARRERKQ